MQVEQNYYKLFGVSPNASVKEINEAYRKLAFQYHPDRNQMSPESNRKMRELNEAYAILSNPVKRKEYDIPFGYRAVTPKFKPGTKVKINAHSSSPYRDHTGIVDKEPEKGQFRFWYMVRFENKYFSTINKFAEEELSKADE
jgi:curved DNA-binding protein CbpA